MSASKRDCSGDVAGPPALSRVLYSKSNDVSFIVSVCVFMCDLCEKYCNPIPGQYCITLCVSWVPRLTFLHLQRELTNALSEWNSFACRGLLYWDTGFWRKKD